MTDDIGMKIAKAFWEMDGGGRDFHRRKWNHAAAEGYEKRIWKPFYPFGTTKVNVKHE